jgi:predicted nucleic acid-binding protein
MSEIVYFDTSALAKWYLNEAQSEKVEKYLHQHGPVAISDLTVVEMRCLLARRRRERSIAAAMEMEIFRRWGDRPFGEGILRWHPREVLLKRR